jgi:hypothetical protein
LTAVLFGAFSASLAAAEGGALRDGVWNDGELIGPGVDDLMAIDVVDTGHDEFLEFVF